MADPEGTGIIGVRCAGRGIDMKRIAKIIPPQKYLHSVLDYNPKTGEFRWKWRDTMPLNWNNRRSGTIAGSKMDNGYIAIAIAIDKTDYKAHRLAWVYVYGNVLGVSDDVDHKDLDTTNNNIDNLRVANHGQNMANRKRNKGKLLPKGVYKDGEKYRSIIRFQNKNISLGTYVNIQAAESAYLRAAIKYKGEFARAS